MEIGRDRGKKRGFGHLELKGRLVCCVKFLSFKLVSS